MKEYVFGNIEIGDAELAVKCIICDNYIPITQREADSIHIKVCDECKTSIKWAKERMKEQEAVYPIKDIARNKRCPKCFSILKGKFCYDCGQAVKWE